MSYDMSVFDVTVAPQTQAAFLAWYDDQMAELIGDDPAVATEPLRMWFEEFIRTFPPLNGPLATEDFDGPRCADYSLGQSLIHGAFSYSQAEAAYRHALDLAGRHGVGFYNPSSSKFDAWLPASGGEMTPISE